MRQAYVAAAFACPFSFFTAFSAYRHRRLMRLSRLPSRRLSSFITTITPPLLIYCSPAQHFSLFADYAIVFAIIVAIDADIYFATPPLHCWFRAAISCEVRCGGERCGGGGEVRHAATLAAYVCHA